MHRPQLLLTDCSVIMMWAHRHNNLHFPATTCSFHQTLRSLRAVPAKGEEFYSWSSVHPMSCSRHAIGCTEDQLLNSSLFTSQVYEERQSGAHFLPEQHKLRCYSICVRSSLVLAANGDQWQAAIWHGNQWPVGCRRPTTNNWRFLCYNISAIYSVYDLRLVSRFRFIMKFLILPSLPSFLPSLFSRLSIELSVLLTKDVDGRKSDGELWQRQQWRGGSVFSCQPVSGSRTSHVWGSSILRDTIHDIFGATYYYNEPHRLVGL